MKDDSAHFGATSSPAPDLPAPNQPTLQPRTSAEAKAWAARFHQASNGPTQYLPAEYATGARGWYTIPKAIRFAVWICAIWVIASLVGIALAAVLWGAWAVAVLSQL